jgi:hypothetical protein
MVTENARLGLIVTAGRRSSALLDDLIAFCDWPVLFQPSVRLVFQQIEVVQPRCLLFWLEGKHEIWATARLIARLRDRGPRPYRVAIAHSLDEDVEPMFRAAGVHSYLSASSNIAALVSGALNALLDSGPAPAPTNGVSEPQAQPAVMSQAIVRGSPATMRPP